MASDIFSVEPPRWLQEISIGDTQANAARATALGLRARQQQDESRLMGLRVQAQMLQSQARIQALENANAAAAMHLQVQEGQLKLAAERLKSTAEAAQRKVGDVQTYHNLWNTLDAPTRQKLDEMNPNWLVQGPTLDQWNVLNSNVAAKAQADAAKAKALGLVPAAMKDGNVTYKTGEGTDMVHFINDASGQPKWFTWKGNLRPLDSVSELDKIEIQAQAHRVNAFVSQYAKDPTDKEAARRANLAQQQLDGMIKAHRLPIAPPQGATPAPVSQTVEPAAGVPVAAPAPATTGDLIRVKHPSGQIGTIPASQLQEAIGAGYTPVTDNPQNTD